MEIIFIRERQSSQDIVSQVKNSIISRIEQAVNAINSDYETKNSETLVLPIVPKNNPFKTLAEVKNYKGLEREYNVPTYQSLKSFSWSSFFPVNKSYSFQHAGSNINGYDYVDFLQDRQINQLPFRLIAFDTNTLTRTVTNIAGDVVNRANVQEYLSSPIRIFFDGFVVVNEFQYELDNAKDLSYTLSLQEFNVDILESEKYKLSWSDLGVNTATNVITKYALKGAGLI